MRRLRVECFFPCIHFWNASTGQISVNNLLLIVWHDLGFAFLTGNMPLLWKQNHSVVWFCSCNSYIETWGDVIDNSAKIKNAWLWLLGNTDETASITGICRGHSNRYRNYGCILIFIHSEVGRGSEKYVDWLMFWTLANVNVSLRGCI